MTKTIRRVVRYTVTPVVLLSLWLFVRIFSVFIVGVLGADHNGFEANMARTLMWPSLGLAGAALIGWEIAKAFRWEIFRTVLNECFSVFMAVFLGIMLALIHARYHWWWYAAAGVVALAALIAIDHEDERHWSRTARFIAIPLITLATIHYAALPG